MKKQNPIKTQNPWNVLGIGDDADEKEVKEAYRMLVKRYHPDLNKSPNASEKFREIQEAYQDIIRSSQYQKVIQSKTDSLKWRAEVEDLKNRIEKIVKNEAEKTTDEILKEPVWQEIIHNLAAEIIEKNQNKRREKEAMKIMYG